jgi:hypothetical protein
MLTRSSQIGEFYVMSPPQVRPSDGNSLFSCDMMLYDEESDRHVRIPWKDALGACLLDDPKLMQPEVRVANGANSKMPIADWLGQAQAWATYNEEEYKSTEEANKAYLKAAAKGGADIRIVVARPFIEHLMHNAILTVAGRDTGATLFGPADMQLSANTQVKTIEGYACLFELTHTHAHTHFLSISIPWHGVPVAHTLCECNGGRDTMGLQEQRWAQIGVLARHSSKEVAVQDYVLTRRPDD